MPAALMVAVLLAACASPPMPSPTPASVGDDAIVALTGELVRAWNTGGDDVVRVVREHLGPRAVTDPTGVLVVPTLPRPPLGLVVDLQDLRPCRDAGSGVVVGDPARLTGCGVRAMAALASFILVVEREPAVAFEVLVDGAPRLVATSVWAADDGGITRVSDVDVFEVGLVEPGILQLDLRRAGGAADLDGLVVAAGRALAWRSVPRLPVVLDARDGVRRRSLVERLRDPLDAWTSPDTIDLVVERCRLVAPPTPTAVRVGCHVLPGSSPADVRDAVVAAVDDAGVVVEVSRWVPVTTTSPGDVLVQALTRRLAVEGIETTPMVAHPVAASGSPRDHSACRALRERGIPCAAGLPLAHRATGPAPGGPADDAIDVDELKRLAGRVDDVAASLVGAASDDRPRASDGAR